MGLPVKRAGPDWVRRRNSRCRAMGWGWFWADRVVRKWVVDTLRNTDVIKPP